MSKKVIDLREVTSFEGLVALGVDTIKNESVQVPLEFVKQGANSAIAAAQSAVAATQAAATATSNANTATTAANTAAGLATTAAQMANIEALAQAAVKAAEDANKATVNADTATKAANTAVGAIDDKIAPKLNTPTTNAASTAAIRNLVGQTSSGTPVRVSPSQLRALVGVDHSILTEQIVPGEKWPDRNGDLRQVYVRTIIGRIPATPWVVDPTLYDVKFGINAWQWNIVASQFVTDSGWTLTPTIVCDSTGALSTLVKVADMAANAPYMIILKYTKR